MQRHYFVDKAPCSQSYVFSSSHVWMRELDHKEGWVLKNWCFWTVVLKKTLVSPMDSKGIKPVNPKGNQAEYSLEGQMLKLQYFGHLIQSWLTRKDPMPGNIEGRRRKGHRGWDGWMASLTHWTWVWANSGRHWRREKPGELQSMRLQSQTQLRDWTTTYELIQVYSGDYFQNIFSEVALSYVSCIGKQILYH